MRDGEIVTACQAVCPTEAIVFGNINDPNSRVSKLKADRAQLFVAGGVEHAGRARRILAALRNPNPEIKA